MAYTDDLLEIFKKEKTPLSSNTLSDLLNYPVTSYRPHSPGSIAVNLSDMEKKKWIKFSHRGHDHRTKYYVLYDVPIEEKVEDRNIKEYKQRYKVEPIDNDICKTIQQIRWKVIQGEPLNPEEEEYISKTVANIIFDEEKEEY